MKQLTVDDILVLRPCGWDDDGYTTDRITELFAGRETVTLADVVQMTGVPFADIVWLAARVFTARQRVIFACKCAEDAGMSARDAAAAARDAARAAAEERQLLYICETLLETD